MDQKKRKVGRPPKYHTEGERKAAIKKRKAKYYADNKDLLRERVVKWKREKRASDPDYVERERDQMTKGKIKAKLLKEIKAALSPIILASLTDFMDQIKPKKKR